jgi:hypothetical protein
LFNSQHYRAKATECSELIISSITTEESHGFQTGGSFRLARGQERSKLDKVVTMSNRDVAYSPKELASFKTVFEAAIASLSPMMVTTCNRLQVAQNILACAATGERDPIELGHAALANVRGSVATGVVRRQ